MFLVTYVIWSNLQHIVIYLAIRKFQTSRVHPSNLPPVCLVWIPHDKDMITPGCCFTILDSSLSPAIMNLFISCTKPSSNLNPQLSQGKVQAIPPKLGSFLRVSKQLHMGLAFTSHVVDIYVTQNALEERMRETGWQQGATQFKSKQKFMIYNSWETVSEFEEFTHGHDTN